MNTYIQDKLDELIPIDIDLLMTPEQKLVCSRQAIVNLFTDYHNHIVEKVKNWFDSELENNKGDIKTYRNIHQDKEGILSLLQDTNPKE